MSAPQICLVNGAREARPQCMAHRSPNQSASAYVASGFISDTGVGQTFAVVDRGFCKYVQSGFEITCNVFLVSGYCRIVHSGFETISDVVLYSGLCKIVDSGFETGCDLFL